MKSNDVLSYIFTALIFYHMSSKDFSELSVFYPICRLLIRNIGKKHYLVSIGKWPQKSKPKNYLLINSNLPQKVKA